MSSISQAQANSRCDICNKPFHDFVYDARTAQGPWAWMCDNCFFHYGRGLGTGLGQKYDTKTLKKVQG